MLFTAAQQEEYERNGYIVLRDAFPGLLALTTEFVGAYQLVAEDEPIDDGVGNKFRTRAQIPGSYWSSLDHSLPALRIMLHEEVVELGRQLLGADDIYLRNGGVNEMAPSHTGFSSAKTVKWHRDSLSHWYDGERTWDEFMHYPFADGQGCDTSRGCLRLIPGSHYWSEEQNAEFVQMAGDLREQQGLPRNYSDLVADARVAADVYIEGEVSITLGPADLLLRKGTIYHCTHQNHGSDGRLMQHWLFRAHDHVPNNHRFRWEEYLSHALINQLSDAQRQVLWLGRGQDLDERYSQERGKEAGKVFWGTLTQSAKL